MTDKTNVDSIVQTVVDKFADTASDVIKDDAGTVSIPKEVFRNWIIDDYDFYKEIQPALRKRQDIKDKIEAYSA